MGALNPLRFARECLGFHPDAPQARILERALDFHRIGLNCSRQWGRSTVAAVLAVYQMVTQEGVTVLVVGPSQRQAGETVEKARKFLRRMGLKRLPGDGVNDISAVLPNGSRIVALPAKEATIRGFSAVSMLIIDEAARVPDEIFQALLPSLAVSGGDLVMMSTPRGKRGRFFREMTAAENERTWLRHTGPVTECERIPKEFLEQERMEGDTYFLTEYMCEFVETGKYLLDEALVRGMVNKNEEPWRLG
jgi:hypothetical protein